MNTTDVQAPEIKLCQQEIIRLRIEIMKRHINVKTKINGEVKIKMHQTTQSRNPRAEEIRNITPILCPSTAGAICGPRIQQ